jgi:DeoR family fructose operon transcriptional repressor
VHGDKAVQHIDSYHAHKAFIGVDGISAENGLTAHSEHESTITAAFIRNAEQTFLLCDSSKVGKDSYIKFSSLSDITCLVTDKELVSTIQDQLIKKGLQVILAE